MNSRKWLTITSIFYLGGYLSYALRLRTIAHLETVFLAIFGIFVLFRLLSRHYSASLSILVTLTVAFASNLYLRGSVHPDNSSALLFLSCALFLYFLDTKRKPLNFIQTWLHTLTLWPKATLLMLIFVVLKSNVFIAVFPLLALIIAPIYQWLWGKGWREFYFFVIFIIPLSFLNLLTGIYGLLITSS